MRLIVVNVDPKRWRRIRVYWENRGIVAERFAGTEGSILDSYRRLQIQAVAEGWDESYVVAQDDVRFPEGIPDHQGIICVYGSLRDSGHVCPHAFSATADGWDELEVWSAVDDGEPHPTCRYWRPVVEAVGTVLNVVAHPGV